MNDQHVLVNVNLSGTLSTSSSLSPLFFSNHKWALCPVGHFLEGLRRTGGGLHQRLQQEIRQGLQHIEEGNCCKPKNLPNSYLECKIKDVDTAFERGGWSECEPGYYLVGFYRGNCDLLKCLDKLKCCSMNCSSNFCKNRATCRNSRGTYTCDCKLGYTGSRCETG